MNADDQIRHTSDCAWHNVTQRRGAEGDIVQRCHTCGRIAVLDDAGQRIDRRLRPSSHTVTSVDLVALVATATRLGVPVWSWNSGRGDLVRIA